MSVINQMLKDLEGRDNKVTATQHSAKLQTPSDSNKSTLLYAIAFLLVIVCAGLLYLILEKDRTGQVERAEVSIPPENKSTLQAGSQQTIGAALPKREPIAQANDIEPQSNSPLNADSTKVMNADAQSLTRDEAARTAVSKETSANQLAEKTTQPLSGGEIDIVKKKTLSEKPPAQQAPEVVETTPKPSLSIKASEVSESTLIEKKTQDVEMAIEANDFDKAIASLSDILVLSPSNHSSREQLAALLFGKNELSQARDILMQGVTLYPEQWSFRLMLAKIHVSLGLNGDAFDVLKVMPNVTDTEYQSMLANLAQSNQSFELAVNSYTYLAQSYPYQSRWWLGLAIAYDSASQFDNAKNAYRQAMQQKDISAGSIKFIQNRLVELGE